MPVVESTVQIELAADVVKVRTPELELVVTVGVSVAPGRKIATFELGYVNTRVGVARVITRSAGTKVIAYLALLNVPC
jgi:hypothetical protein